LKKILITLLVVITMVLPIGCNNSSNRIKGIVHMNAPTIQYHNTGYTIIYSIISPKNIGEQTDTIKKLYLLTFQKESVKQIVTIVT